MNGQGEQVRPLRSYGTLNLVRCETFQREEPGTRVLGPRRDENLESTSIYRMRLLLCTCGYRINLLRALVLNLWVTVFVGRKESVSGSRSYRGRAALTVNPTSATLPLGLPYFSTVTQIWSGQESKPEVCE